MYGRRSPEWLLLKRGRQVMRSSPGFGILVTVALMILWSPSPEHCQAGCGPGGCPGPVCGAPIFDLGPYACPDCGLSPGFGMTPSRPAAPRPAMLPPPSAATPKPTPRPAMLPPPSASPKPTPRPVVSQRIVVPAPEELGIRLEPMPDLPAAEELGIRLK